MYGGLNARVDMQRCHDWSRTTRKQLALMKSSSDQHQSKITKNFQVVSDVSCLLQGNPDVKKILESFHVNCGMVEAVAGSTSVVKGV